MAGNTKQQPEALGEEELEDVAGGSNRSQICLFKPEKPVVFKDEHGAVKVKCNADCNAVFSGYNDERCRCFGTVYCTGRWHIVEQVSPGVWYPMPRGQFKHDNPVN